MTAHLGLLAAALSVAVTLALPAAAEAACVVPGHRTVAAGRHVVFSFSGISPSFQRAFRAADASVAGIVDTGGRAYPVHVHACHIHRAGTHGITGIHEGAASICIDSQYAGRSFTDATRVTDAQGDTFYIGVLAFHELGHAIGLNHPRSAGCHAPASLMNPEMTDDGRPGRYGPADVATLRRVYHGR